MERPAATGLRGEAHHTLPRKAIPPFVSWEGVGLGGAHGQVFKAEMHNSHHNFDIPAGNNNLAVKLLHSTNEAFFKAEVMMLKMLSGEDHPHILSLLTTYEQNGVYHLVFPWGESDLRSYWTATDPRGLDKVKTALWIVRQCAGIADGLLRIHGPHRMGSANVLAHSNSFKQFVEPADDHERPPSSPSVSGVSDAAMSMAHHGDMKASNVIMFANHPGGNPAHGDDEWTLRIADFGMAGFASRRGGTAMTARTPTYAAPEYRIRGAIIRESACDVWALGCMYLEFVAWYFGGRLLLEDFVERRRRDDDAGGDSFYLAHPVDKADVLRVEVKPSVLDFIQELHEHDLCTDVFHDFLHMIQEHMLVVEKLINAGPGRARSSCKDVKDMMDQCRQRCEKDARYLTLPRPWTRKYLAVQHIIMTETVH